MLIYFSLAPYAKIKSLVLKTGVTNDEMNEAWESFQTSVSNEKKNKIF